MARQRRAPSTSRGGRAGSLQRRAGVRLREGWACQTWEGQVAKCSLCGAAAVPSPIDNHGTAFVPLSISQHTRHQSTPAGNRCPPEDSAQLGDGVCIRRRLLQLGIVAHQLSQGPRNILSHARLAQQPHQYRQHRLLQVLQAGRGR